MTKKRRRVQGRASDLAKAAREAGASAATVELLEGMGDQMVQLCRRPEHV